jgi:transcriptional/translational regulatory protein YebC/TACO1
MGNPGSVAFMFQTKGQIFIDAGKADEDTIMELALEAGADDVQEPEGDGDGAWTILTPADFLTVKEAIEAAGIEIAESEITKIPDNTCRLDRAPTPRSCSSSSTSSRTTTTCRRCTTTPRSRKRNSRRSGER